MLSTNLNAMKYVIQFLLLFLLLAFATSCEEEQFTLVENETPTTVPAVSVHNGILTFRDFASFTPIYIKMAEASVELSEVLPGLHFTSLNDVQANSDELVDNEKATEAEFTSFLSENRRSLYIEPGDSSISPIIDDPAVQEMVNSNGLLIIGDTLYQFTLFHVRRIALSDISNPDNTDDVLRQLDNAGDKDTKEVFVFYDKDAVDDFMEKSACRTSCTAYLSNKYRMKGKVWKRDLWIIRSHGVRTNSQKKRWYGWSGKKASSIYVAGYYRGVLQKERRRKNKKKAAVVLSLSGFGGSLGDRSRFLDLSFPTDGYHEMTRSNRWVSCNTCKEVLFYGDGN